MTQDLTDHFDEIKALSDRASLSNYDFYAQNLKRWYAAIDQAPDPISGRVRWLEGQVDYEELSPDIFGEAEGTDDSGSITWPDEKEVRLSIQLQFFRRLAEGRLDAVDFGNSYLDARSGRYDDIVTEISRHLFDPFSDELIRFLKRRVNDPVPVVPIAPASDRIVLLNHNSAEYIKLNNAISHLGDVLGSTNVGDPDDRDIAKVELGAAKQLLRATRIRLDFLTRVVSTTLKWIAIKFAEASVGELATVALLALGTLIKAIW